MKKKEFEVVGEIALDELLEQAQTEPADAETSADRIDGVVIGRLIEFADDGRALVEFDGGDSGAPSICESLARLDNDMIGRDVALMFRDGDPSRPFVLGAVESSGPAARKTRDVEVTRDGERLELTANKEIVLRCGDASLTLTRSGKVLIRGAYVSSRSSGVNRVNGASVQIN